MNGFLVKPSESSKLLGMVEALKDFWLTHNALPAESYRQPQSAPPPSGTAAPGANPAGLAPAAPPPGPTAEPAGQPTPFWGAAFVDSNLKSAPHTLSLFARDIDAETDD